MNFLRELTIVILGIGALAAAQSIAPLAIMDEPLPVISVGADVRIPLHASGGVPPYHWRIASGELPEGIVLTPDGVLLGRVAKPTTLDIHVTVEDSASPPHSVTKEIRTQVSAALVFDWVRPPQSQGNRIEGAAEVSNSAKDDFDLTVIVVAVNDVGRATALGYQHVKLPAGAMKFQVPFGATLPRGAYVVHADAVAEIAPKNTILRQRLETPAPLPVTQGP